MGQEAPAPSAAESAEGDVVVLNPFVVSSQGDKGYFAQNTLAGSRMNTNIADLGASISVVTKAELEDTASVDLNDMFRYQVNTEGSSTYTPATLAFRSDGFLDVNSGGTQGNAVGALTNATANRVRGLGVPTAAINYYPAISSVPPDAYNTSSFEISRGPNSMLFGLGSPAGIVNQSTAQADVRRKSAQVSVRFDDRGSFREALNFNFPLIKDKLGFYGAVVSDDRRFERKPSYDNTKRGYGALTWKPFSKTTIRASIEGYKNDSRRPNTLTPRDFVTEWNLAGQPAYDPLTRTVTNGAGSVLGVYVVNASSPYANDVRNFIESRPGFNASLWNGAKTTYNGVTIFGQGAATTAGTFVAGQTASNNALFVPGLAWISGSRSVMNFSGGELQSWIQTPYNNQYRTAWGTSSSPTANAPLYPATSDVWANSTWADIYNRDWAVSTGWTGIGNGIIGYKYPGVTDRSVYDWENINVNQANFGHDTNVNMNVELEQQITDDLFLSAGWFRQDFDSEANYTIAQLNATTLFVDLNKNLPTGQPNPFFGKPYVQDFDPDQYVVKYLDDHYRAMLAWTPDFTKQNNILKWLGHHQILGLWSRDESMNTTYRNRLEYVDSTSASGKYRYMANQNNNADGSPTGWNYQTTSLQRHFYLAQPGDPNGVVTEGSGEWNPLTYTGDIAAYDYATSQWSPLTMTTTFNPFDAGTGRNQRVVDSISGGMTSYLWNDRLVATVGVRKDKYKARSTNTGTAALKDADGNEISPAITNAQKWVNGYMQNDGFLFDRWARWDSLEGTTRTYGGVLRPFRNWNSIDRRAADSQFWQFIRDFGVSYNKSTNFNPPPSAQGDEFGNPLPKPQGEGEDWGFQFSLMDNKLFARVTWFKANNLNERTSPGTTLSRLESNIDQTLFRNWARTITLINMGYDPTQAGFGSNLSQTTEDAVQAAAATIWQQPYNYYESLPFGRGATRDAEAEGVEAELNYNPNANWTMKFTFGKQDTKYSNVLNQFTDWYNVRAPIWMAAKAATYLNADKQQYLTYTTAGGEAVDLTNFWTSYGYNGNVGLTNQFGAYNVNLYYDINVTPQILLARDLDGQSAPGQRKYRWSFLTTYNFTEGRLRGVFVGGSERWEDKSVIGYYGKASGANGTSLDVSDITKPIYDEANYYTDLWVGYRRKIFNDTIGMTLRFNIVNVFENGHLQPVGVNYDGSPYAFRIVDPRQFILSATFDF